MQELEHVLDTLLHDVRGPLGVAGGYLRLLREGKMGDDAQADRAIVKAQEALRSVAERCAEAAGWLPRARSAAPVDVPVSNFVDAVAAAADGLRLDRTGATGDHTVRLALPLDRVAEAVVVLMRLAGRGPDPSAGVRVEGGRLCFGGGSAPCDGADAPFDPWQHPGLGVPLARFVVATAGGTCLAQADDPARPLVRFPLA